MFVALDVRVSVTHWQTCPDCHGSGRRADGYSGTDKLGRPHARTVGCEPCCSTGKVPVVSVAGRVPAQLVEKMAAVTDLAPGVTIGDLDFTAEVA